MMAHKKDLDKLNSERDQSRGLDDVFNTPDETGTSDYYYDDSTGYEVYEDTDDESDEENNQEDTNSSSCLSRCLSQRFIDRHGNSVRQV